MSSPAHSRPRDIFARTSAVPASMVFLGFLVRLYLAYFSFLNSDEAQIYFLSAQPSLALTYKAGSLSAHPPLFYFLLHSWCLVGNSELLLRVPSAIAGMLFCWIAFRWVQRVADGETALLALFFFCFTPALVLLGAEVRQYSLLLLWVAACLYFLEVAIQDNSALAMSVFSVSLWLAILTQYSAWIFCFSVGIYALVRFYYRRPSTRVIAVWIAGQGIGIALYVVLGFTQLPWLRKVARVDGIFQTRYSPVAFLARETFRLFHYLFGQPIVGGATLLFFIVGVIGLFRDTRADGGFKISQRQLASLLLLPWITIWTAGAFCFYPFEGTRHSIVLAIFVIAGASIGLAQIRVLSWRNKLLFVAALLIGSYVFSVPLGPHISRRNQDRRLMLDAVDYVRRSAPRNSVFLVDDQSSYLFRYYFCRNQPVQFSAVPGEFRDFSCGDYRVAGSRQWMLTPEKLASELERGRRVYGLHSHDPVWIFQAGWNVNREPQLRAKLDDFHCSVPASFGANILLCRVNVYRERS